MALYPDYSGTLLMLMAGGVAAFLIWALVLSLSSAWKSRQQRAAYLAAVLTTMAAFSVVLAWRSLGGDAHLAGWLGALFVAVIVAGLSWSRPLVAVLAWGGGSSRASPRHVSLGVSAVTLALVTLLLIRLAPVWFAQHLLLPAALLVALIAAAGVRGNLFR
jgi:hypothetical protein